MSVLLFPQILFLVFSLSSYQPQKFTTCIPYSVNYLKHDVESASMIFSATLLNVSTTKEKSDLSHDSIKVNTYKLPDRIWRGISPDTIQLKSTPRYDDLSVLVKGGKYLFLIDSSWINQCSPIVEDFSDMAKELDRLSKKKSFKNFKLQTSTFAP
ncbi:hypothetical protein [Hymenobacter sp. DG25A]|uniref:hypothetical protein n=1 Tax=Hymenobacter sp. DG25A TaxID=1385663 RepID=UPI0006BD95F3|nr:hypothetical protein [Hymenobacter sp. DG25A]ALD21212.1 hypothetical protein AM218_08275 [Hymenobacter sp. DG25A]